MAYTELPEDIREFLATTTIPEAEELREKYGLKPPVKGPVFFKYYLHDDYTRGEFAEHLESEGVHPVLAEEMAEQRPFYEVTFEMKYDPATKVFEIVSVKL